MLCCCCFGCFCFENGANVISVRKSSSKHCLVKSFENMKVITYSRNAIPAKCKVVSYIYIERFVLNSLDTWYTRGLSKSHVRRKKMNAARVNAVKTDPSTQKRTAKLWWKSTQWNLMSNFHWFRQIKSDCCEQSEYESCTYDLARTQFSVSDSCLPWLDGIHLVK